MYKIGLTVILNFSIFGLSAQFSAIELETNNVLFIGIENKINIAAENTSCNSLLMVILTVKNANIHIQLILIQRKKTLLQILLLRFIKNLIINLSY